MLGKRPASLPRGCSTQGALAASAEMSHMCVLFFVRSSHCDAVNELYTHVLTTLLLALLPLASVAQMIEELFSLKFQILWCLP